MSYPGLIDEHPLDAKQRYHEECHIGENEFDDQCSFCYAEKCLDCRGAGMTNDCKKICSKCDGRGRLL